MASLFSDSGGAAGDANPIGGNFSTAPSFNPIQRTGSKFANSQGFDVDCGAYVNSVTPPNDHYAQVTVDTVGGGDAGPMVRISTSAQSCYFIQNADGATVLLYSISSGSYNLVDSDAGSYGAGQSAYLEAQGTTILSKVNNVTKNNATDATLASGRFGLNMYTAATRFTNFDGGDFSGGGGGGSIAAISNYYRMMRGG